MTVLYYMIDWTPLDTQLFFPRANTVFHSCLGGKPGNEARLWICTTQTGYLRKKRYYIGLHLPLQRRESSALCRIGEGRLESLETDHGLYSGEEYQSCQDRSWSKVSITKYLVRGRQNQNTSFN